MKDIIINQPHLQSFRQKLASVLLSVISWLLWLYFLFPLFTLGGWLMGVKHLSDEIRWFGGYKTLLELLELYGVIIVAIGLCWLIWTLGRSWLRAGRRIQPRSVVSDGELCAVFHVDAAKLMQARTQQTVTVHFDEHANILLIDCQPHNRPEPEFW